MGGHVFVAHTCWAVVPSTLCLVGSLLSLSAPATLEAKLWGASGGSRVAALDTTITSGAGGYTHVLFPVRGQDSLGIMVGKAGNTSTGGWPRGGFSVGPCGEGRAWQTCRDAIL